MNDNNSNEFKVPDFDLGVKKAIKGVASNSSLITALLAIIAAFMIFFTDLDGGFKIQALYSPSAVILLFLCLVEYSSTKQMGTIEGKKEQVYIEAVEKHKKTSTECQAKCKIRGVMDFCTEYTEQELIKARASILKQIDMPYEIYAEKYVGLSKRELPKDLPRGVKKCIVRANKLKPMYISQDNLIFKEDAQKHSRLTLSPKKKDRIKDITSLTPVVLHIFFAVQIAAEILAEPTFATIAEAMLKLTILVRCATKGYSNGYYNIVDTHVNCMETSTYLLQECISYHDAKKEVTDGTIEETNNKR